MESLNARLLRVVNANAEDLDRVRQEHESYDLSLLTPNVSATLSQCSEDSDEEYKRCVLWREKVISWLTNGRSTSSDSDATSLRNRRHSASDASLDSASSIRKDQSKFKVSLTLATMASGLSMSQTRAGAALTRWQESHNCVGWRFGVLTGCCTAIFVLLSNIGLLAVGATRHGGYAGGIAEIY